MTVSVSPSTCKVITPPLSKSPSELAFSTLEPPCQAHLIKFHSNLGGQPLDTRSCPDPSSKTLYLHEDDLSVSSLPSGVAKEPAYLCKFHFEVYLLRRQTQLCQFTDCLRIATAGTSLCHLHFTLTDLGTPVLEKLPSVRFQDDNARGVDDKTPLESPEGLTYMSPTLI